MEFNFDDHVREVQWLRQQRVSAHELRQRRIHFLSHLPLTKGQSSRREVLCTQQGHFNERIHAELWVDWINDETQSGLNREMAATLADAVAQDCPAVEVWDALCLAAATIDEADTLRDMLSRAASSLSSEPNAGSAAWRRLLAFEEAALTAARQAESDDDDSDGEDASSREVAVAVERVRAVFQTLLALPLPGADDTMAKYIAFESEASDGPSPSRQDAIDKVATAFEAASHLRVAQRPFEDAIEAARATMRSTETAGAAVDEAGAAQADLLASWVRYIDAEESGALQHPSSTRKGASRGAAGGGSSPARLLALFERAVLDCFWSSELWMRAAGWAERGLRDPGRCPALYRRGARNCLTVPELWEGALRCSASAYVAALKRFERDGDASTLTANVSGGLQDPIVALQRAGRSERLSAQGAGKCEDAVSMRYGMPRRCSALLSASPLPRQSPILPLPSCTRLTRAGL